MKSKLESEYIYTVIITVSYRQSPEYAIEGIIVTSGGKNTDIEFLQQNLREVEQFGNDKSGLSMVTRRKYSFGSERISSIDGFTPNMLADCTIEL